MTRSFDGMTMAAIDYHAIMARRPLFHGPFASEPELIGFNPDGERVEPMLEPYEVPTPILAITPKAEQQLRVGLGRVDMDIRWLA